MTVSRPIVGTACADCGVGTLTLREWYMVNNEIWEQAWAGQRKSWYCDDIGVEILCIGCLENRIGGTLMATDFIDCPLHHLGDNSPRLRQRLATTQGSVKGTDGLIRWLIEGMIKEVSPEHRAGAREAIYKKVFLKNDDEGTAS